MKRLAAKASLQRCAENKIDEQILTPTAFYAFCMENIFKIEFAFASNSDYENEFKLLMERHDMASTIAGTQKLHHFKPLCSLSLLVPIFKFSNISNQEDLQHRTFDPRRSN